MRTKRHSSRVERPNFLSVSPSSAYRIDLAFVVLNYILSTVLCQTRSRPRIGGEWQFVFVSSMYKVISPSFLRAWPAIKLFFKLLHIMV